MAEATVLNVILCDVASRERALLRTGVVWPHCPDHIDRGRYNRP